MIEIDDDDSVIGDAKVILGVDKAQAKLVTWLKKIVDNPDTQAAPTLTLYQMTKTQGEKSVAPFGHDFDKPCEETVAEVLEAAQEDMDGHFGKVQYALRVNGREDRSTFILDCPIRKGTSDEFHRDHFPDMQGLTAQQMEQNQFLVEKVVETAGQSNELLMRIIADQRLEITALKRREFEMMRNVESLVDAREKRNMMYEDHRRELERKDKMLETAGETVKMIGPPLVAHYLGPQAAQLMMSMAAAASNPGGGEGVGEKSDIDILDEWVVSLKKRPHKFQQIMGSLDASDVAILSELLRRSEARQEAKAAAQAAQTQANAAQAAEAQNGSNVQGNTGTTSYGAGNGYSYGR